MNKIVIFGVGLIGGSLALALKAQHAHVHIVGVSSASSTPEARQEAFQLGIVDEMLCADDDALNSKLGAADLIVLAAPVAQTTPILQRIKPHLQAHTLITDVGSTKQDVMLAAQSVLGEQLQQFVGGHPIAGAEKSGPSAARPDLFKGKNVIITPAPTNHVSAITAIHQLWSSTGANICQLDAQTHDQVFATVSHLPHLLAFALVNEIANRPNADMLFNFAASGFRDFTRIAGSSPEMWRDISLANKTALLKEISAYEQQLAHIKNLLTADDSEGLKSLFSTASTARNHWGKSQ